MHADIEKAREIWVEEKETEGFVDIRKWIKEEGFLEIVGKMKIAESSKKDNTGKSKSQQRTIRNCILNSNKSMMSS